MTLKQKTPMQRKVPMKVSKPAPGPRLKRCAVCREKFQPRSMTHKACKPECAAIHAEAIRKVQDRKSDRERRVALKTRQDWLREAQAAFNAFIRARDHDQPCISCGRFHQGQWHAGHFRSVGAMAALRFDESNVHKQCAPCNNHLSGNILEYRLRLICKIGQVAVDWLEMDHSTVKYSIEDAQNIKSQYVAKLKQLKEQQS